MNSGQVERQLKVGLLVSGNRQVFQSVQGLIDGLLGQAPTPFGHQQSVASLQVPQLRH